MSAETVAAPALPTAPPTVPEHSVGGRLRAGTRERWLTFAAIGLLSLVSLYLRTRALSVHYWVDEGISVGIARHPLSQIPHLLREDGSPPLYYVLLHFWIRLFGAGEVATHTLSLIPALLIIPAAFWAGSVVFDRRTGLFCAALAAGAPYLTAYAQETRMYSLMALLSLLAATGFVQVYVWRRRRYLALFVAALAAVLYTHNWGLFFGVMAGLAFLVCIYRAAPDGRRALWRDGLIGFGGVALLFLPWLPTVVYQSQHTGAPWDLPPVIWSLSQGSYFLVGGRGAAVALLLAGGTGLLALRPAAIAPLIDVASPSRRLAPDPSDERPTLERAAICLLVLALGTMVLAWVISKATPAWAPRYLAVVVGPAILLFGLGLARAGRLGIVALVLVGCFWILDPVPTALNYKSDVAAAVAHIRHDLRPGSLVLSTQPEQVPTLDYYMPAGMEYATPLGRVPDPGVMDWRNALARFRRSSVDGVLMPLLDQTHPGQRVVLVTALNLAKQPLWMVLINRASRQWTRVLAHDPHFVRIGFSSPQLVSGLAVRVSVYLRRDN
jgi:mannosyltransferase